MPFTDALAEGSVLLQYRIDNVLGQGGFGITYKGMDVRLKMAVAIKEFFPQNIAVRTSEGAIRPKSPDDVKPFKTGLASFLKEARTLAQFHHANIVQVHNFFDVLGSAYMVMAFEEGECLSSVIKRRKQDRLGEKELLPIILPILDGMDVLHSSGFIHRDIKPGNIYMRQDGAPVLLDFGAARQTMGIATQTLTTILTPGYAPMEQYYTSSKQQGPWTDIYSIAAVLYCMITGKPPVHAPDRSSAIMGKKADPIHQLTRLAGPKYSPAFLSALEHALQVLAQDRPRNVSEFRAELLGKSVSNEPNTKHAELAQTDIVDHVQTSKPDTTEDGSALTVYGTTMPSINSTEEKTVRDRGLPTKDKKQVSFVNKFFYLLMLANVALMVLVSVEKVQQLGAIKPVLIVYSGLVNIFPALWLAVGLLIWKINKYLKQNKNPRPSLWSFLKPTLTMEILGVGLIIYLIYGG